MKFGLFSYKCETVGTLTCVGAMPALKRGTNEICSSMLVLVIVCIMLVFAPPILRAQTINEWTNAVNGKWEDTTGWDDGVLPSSEQLAVVAPPGVTTTVTIDSATAQSHPESMTVEELEIVYRGTVVLSNTLDTVPFFVTNQMYFPDGGLFDQEAGTCICPSVQMNSGTCHLGGGNMFAGLLNMAYNHPGYCNFVQDGGTNSVGSVYLNDGGAEYDLNGGALFAGSEVVLDTLQEETVFRQSGGLNFVTNTLTLKGASGHDSVPAQYFLSGGTLMAQSLQLDDTWGYSDYIQTAGTTLISGAVEAIGTVEAPGYISIGSGIFGCANFSNSNGDVHIGQSSGQFIVTNTFHFSGYFPGARGTDYNIPAGFAEYSFSGGTLWASNIELSGVLDISNSVQTGRITNPGYFELAGTINVGDANEQLGPLILASDAVTNYPSPVFITNSVINFTGSETVLSFASSQSETWSNRVMLSVSNWNGSLNGGGNHQLRFGSDASALTSSQIAQIQFLNPANFPAGTYAAKILSTGEVVPNAPSVYATTTSNGLVISWPDSSYTLQFATNVLGPWTNVVNAVSPYTNLFGDGPQEFFRLQR